MRRSRRSSPHLLGRERSRFASHYPSRSGPDTPPLIFYMFVEDAHSHIMPFPRLSEGESHFDAVFEGPDADTAMALRILQGFGQYSSRYHDTLQATCDAVRDIAQRLLWNGRAAYEIPTVKPEKREDRDIIGKEDDVTRVRSFTTARLFRLPGLFVQFAPLRDRKYFGRSVFAARSRHVWLVSMPRALGGTSGYRRMRRRLSRFPLTAPLWAPQAMAKESDTVRYDFVGHRRLLELYVASAVRTWGWNRRDWSDDHQTEFFNFYRMITFQWALAVLRDHIVEELNGLLKRIGLSARLTLKGFTGPDDILAVRERMRRGDINLGDAYSAVGFTRLK